MTAAQISTQASSQPIRVNAPLAENYDRILTPEALRFVAEIERRFGKRRQQMMGLREDRQHRLNNGELPGFRLETAELKTANWRVKLAPPDLRDRRVEITGPVDRETIRDALVSGASCFIADFEDAQAPTWNGIIEGQINLYDAVRGSLGEQNPAGRHEQPAASRTTLIMRPRGLHQTEYRLQVDGHPVSASLFDFGLFMFHNGLQLLEQGNAPCFCLPKLESYIEAQLWADLFAYAEESLGLNHGCTCCTVAIETLPAAFEMEEMLYTLRDYAVGLDFGRRNYIFSYIKRLHADPDRVLQDRTQISLDSGFLRACSQLLVKTCHERGAHAMCGLSAPLPTEDDPASTSSTLEKFRADLARAVSEGHDGIRMAHAGLVALADAEFERILSQANQPDRQLHELNIGETELLESPQGPISEAGLRSNIRVGLHYLAAWLGGHGMVAIDNFMEDGATAEIARAQIWQWIRYPKGILEDGRDITIELFSEALTQQLEQIRQEVGEVGFAAGHYPTAAKLFSEIVTNDRFIEFLTPPAYQTLA